MVELSFDLIIAAFAMIILNCRGYYKYAMGKQLSGREAARREFMLFPNLLIIVAFTYYCIEGLTTNSFRFMIIAGISFLVSRIIQIAQKKVSKDYKNSLIMIVFLSFLLLFFIYMFLY